MAAPVSSTGGLSICWVSPMPRGCGKCRAADRPGVEAPAFHDRAGWRPLSLRSGVAQNETSITSFPVEEKPPRQPAGLGGPLAPQTAVGQAGFHQEFPHSPCPLLRHLGWRPGGAGEGSGVLPGREAVVPGSPCRAPER